MYKALGLEVAVIHSSTFSMNEMKNAGAEYKVRDIENLALFLKVLV